MAVKAKTKAKPKAKSKPKAKAKPKAKPKSKAKPKAKPKTKTTKPKKKTPTVTPAPSPAPGPISSPTSAAGFQVEGTNPKALFTLKLHRGDGMTLLAMNWKSGTPPPEFVGFAIEYKEPGGDRYFALKNRLGFLNKTGAVDPTQLSTMLSPIQKFRWVHFPRNAHLDGDFLYRVTPVFMNAQDEVSNGDPQEVAIALQRETYPGVADVTFTRGFVSSQAFVDKYGADAIKTLLPATASKGLGFSPTNPDAKAALDWMGFDARAAILALLDAAIADKTAQVRVVAYDFNLPDVVDRLKQLGPRLKIIIDDSGSHKGPDSAETAGEKILVATAGAANVKRQHMGSLQHNKTIAVSGTVNKAVCGSTNLSWRGWFVQSNNALVLSGATAVKAFFNAFDNYFAIMDNKPAAFGATPSAVWTDLGLPNIDAKVAFSPHVASNALLAKVAADIQNNTTSSLLYSMAFLYETAGPIRDAIFAATKRDDLFVYGISDKKVGGLDVQDPNGNVAPVFAAQLSANVPSPFKEEPSGGGGTRMHHKFAVIDFDKPTARVYLGSYNFSSPADIANGENLLVIKDRRIAVSYMIEALTLFDHYSFRVAQNNAEAAGKTLHLSRPPRAAGEKPWWDEDYSNVRKSKDRLLFA